MGVPARAHAPGPQEWAHPQLDYSEAPSELGLTGPKGRDHLSGGEAGRVNQGAGNCGHSPSFQSTVCNRVEEGSRQSTAETGPERPMASESLDPVIPGASYGMTTAANTFFSTPLWFGLDFCHLKP